MRKIVTDFGDHIWLPHSSHEVTLHVAFVHAFVNPTLFLVLHKGLRKATVDLLCCNFRSSDSSRGGAAEDGVWYTVHIFFETQLFKFQLKENSSFCPLSFFILVAAGILFFWQFFLVANLPVKFAFRARSEVEALLKLHFQQTCLTFLRVCTSARLVWHFSRVWVGICVLNKLWWTAVIPSWVAPGGEGRVAAESMMT